MHEWQNKSLSLDNKDQINMILFIDRSYIADSSEY